MFKSKKLVALGLAAVALFSTVGVSLAYWANTVSGSNANTTGTVNVGEGGTVTTTVAVSPATAGGELVPAGFDDDTPNPEVEQADLSFAVTWESTGDDGAGATKTLTVTEASRIAYNSSSADVTATVGTLYNVTLPSSVSIVADAAATTVHVYVTLTEPTFAQYASIAGGSVVLTLTFTVA